LPQGEDAASLEQFEASGLDSAAAVPDVPSILPLPLLGGPEDPAERIDAYCRSMERLAPFRPSGLVLLTGTGDRDVAVDRLRTIARCRATGPPTSRASSPRSTRRAGTACTTSRSSPTTAPSGASTTTRSGRRRRRRRSHAHVKRSSGAGHLPPREWRRRDEKNE